MTTLVGGVLLVLGFLLIPLFLVYGYVVEVIRSSGTGSTEPPTFDDWESLLIDGLKAWAIGIVYMLVPILVAVITVGSVLVSLVTNGNVGMAAGGLLVGFTLSTVLAVVFGYVATAAIVNFAREGRLSAAFDFTVLRQIIFHREYAVAWLVSVVVVTVAGIIGSLPVIGWFLAPFVAFYALTVAGNLWSGGVSAALDDGDLGGSATGRQPAA
jgi:hypothetical protein